MAEHPLNHTVHEALLAAIIRLEYRLAEADFEARACLTGIAELRRVDGRRIRRGGWTAARSSLCNGAIFPEVDYPPLLM